MQAYVFSFNSYACRAMFSKGRGRQILRLAWRRGQHRLTPVLFTAKHEEQAPQNITATTPIRRTTIYFCCRTSCHGVRTKFNQNQRHASSDACAVEQNWCGRCRCGCGRACAQENSTDLCTAAFACGRQPPTRALGNFHVTAAKRPRDLCPTPGRALPHTHGRAPNSRFVCSLSGIKHQEVLIG